jgi:hypothetical protein
MLAKCAVRIQHTYTRSVMNSWFLRDERDVLVKEGCDAYCRGVCRSYLCLVPGTQVTPISIVMFFLFPEATTLLAKFPFIPPLFLLLLFYSLFPSKGEGSTHLEVHSNLQYCLPYPSLKAVCVTARLRRCTHLAVLEVLSSTQSKHATYRDI